MTESPFVEEAARDMVIQMQPILWARAMLDQAEATQTPDARDAILARIGVALFGRFGMTLDMGDMRTATRQWDIA